MLAGDINRDGQVNGSDIAAFLNAITDIPDWKSNNGLTNAQALYLLDVNRDGVVDNHDLQSFINDLIEHIPLVSEKLIGGVGDDTLYDGPGNEWMQGDGGNDTYRFDPSNDLTGTPRTDYVVENSDPATDDDTLNFTGYVEPVVTGSGANQLVAGNLTVTIANGATIADVVGPSVGNVLPAQPGNLSISVVSDSQLDLAWVDQATNESGYTVQRSLDGVDWSTLTKALPAGSTSFSDSGLDDATEYFYRVMATNAIGVSDFSDTQSTYTLPIAPSNIQVTSITPDEVTLTWQNNSTLATSFRIEQQLPDNSWTQIGTASADDNSITLNGTFNPTGTNSFRIEAYAVGGYSAAATMSVTGTAPEAPPIWSSPHRTLIRSTCRGMRQPMPPATRLRSTDGTTWTTIADHQAGTSFADTDLDEATEYYYQVTANDATGSSLSSDIQSANTLPIAPSNLQVASITPDEVTLTWQNNSTLATSFRIEQQLPDNSWTQIGTASADDNSITLNGTFDPTGTNSFRIEAYAVGGYSASATVSSTGTVPVAPAQLKVLPVSNTQFQITWIASATATSYTVERSLDGTSWTTAASGLPAYSTVFVDINRSEGTTVSYRVKAVNSVGVSAPSVTQSGTTLPTAASNLAITSITSTQANLSWQNHSANATSITVEQLISGIWTMVISGLSPTVTSTTVNGSFDTSANTYSFRILTNDTGGSSEALPVSSAAAAIAVTTGDAPGINAYSLATGFTVAVGANFVPATLQNSDTDTLTGPTVSNSTWSDTHGNSNDVSKSVQTDLQLTTSVDGSGNWTYVETYTVTTTVDISSQSGNGRRRRSLLRHDRTHRRNRLLPVHRQRPQQRLDCLGIGDPRRLHGRWLGNLGRFRERTVELLERCRPS